MNKSFLLALVLSTLFTVALVFSTLEAPYVISRVLINFIPDYGLDWEASKNFINTFRPLGYASFIATSVLIAVGFASRWRALSILGSLTLYLPVFGYFASTMFFLAGIGILRLLWLPLFDISPQLLELGSIVYLPYLLLEYVVVFIAEAVFERSIGFKVVHDFKSVFSITFMAVGMLIFFLGTFAWLYSRYRNIDVSDTGIYRYTRHPQYLGILIWSYGLLLFSTTLPIPRGGYVPPPSLPWLIAATALIGVSLNEEINMSRRYGEKYERYRRETPFMLPLPKIVSKILSAPAKLILKKDYPQNRKETISLILSYIVILILLSIPQVIWL